MTETKSTQAVITIPDTGIYTVPYDGTYQFHTLVQSNDGNLVFIEIYVDGSITGSHDDNWSHEQYRSATVLLQLEAGQEVRVYQGNGVLGCSTCLRTYFHGYMIGAI